MSKKNKYAQTAPGNQDPEGGSVATPRADDPTINPYEGVDLAQPQSRNLSIKAAPVKGLTAEECQALCRKAGVEYLDGYEARVTQFVMTDGTVDRYGDKIIAKGVKLDKYKSNPVVLGFHDSASFPIGATLKVWFDREADAVKGWLLLMDDRVDRSGFAETVFRMVRSGFMRTGSIGFIPRKFRRPSDDEERQKLGLGEWGYLFEEVELVEFSIVPIPANPSAVVEPLQKGLFTRRAAETLEREKLVDADLLLLLKASVADDDAAPAQTVESVEAVRFVDDFTAGLLKGLEATPGDPIPDPPNLEPGTVRATPGVNPESFSKARVELEMPQCMTAEQVAGFQAFADSWRARGYEVLVKVPTATPSAAPAPDPAPWSEVKDALRKITEGRTISKRNLETLTAIVGHLEAAMVACQELIDSSYVNDDEEDDPPGDKTSPSTKADDGTPAGTTPGAPPSDPAGSQARSADEGYGIAFLESLKKLNKNKES